MDLRQIFKAKMNGGTTHSRWFMVCIWVIIIEMLTIAALFYFGVFSPPDKFNPELHDCTQWNCDNEKYGLNLVSVAMNQTECDYGIPEQYRDLYVSKSWQNEVLGDYNEQLIYGLITFKGECVSWQPKTIKQNKVNYCHSNPSDAERCECVNECWQDGDGNKYSNSNVMSCSITNFICGWKQLTSSCSGNGICGGMEERIAVKATCVDAVPKVN